MRTFVVGAIAGVVLAGAVFLGVAWASPRSCQPIAEAQGVHWLTESLRTGWVVDGSYNLSGLSIICLHRPLLPLPSQVGAPPGP